MLSINNIDSSLRLLRPSLDPSLDPSLESSRILEAIQKGYALKIKYRSPSSLRTSTKRRAS